MNHLWSKDYIFVIGVNFLIYTVHFALMLWSASYAADHFAAPLALSGLCSGIFIIGALLGRIPAGLYIDLLGRRRLFLWGTSLFFLCIPLYLAAPHLYAFAAIRFLHGLSFGLCSTAASTIAAALIPPAQLGRGIGYYTLGVTLASAAGPFFAMAAIHARQFALCITGAAILAGAVLLLSVLMKVPEHVPTGEERQELRSFSWTHCFVPAALPISCIALIGGICYSSVLSFLGAYTDALRLPAGGTWFFLCFAFTSFVSRPLTGYLLDRHGGNIVIYPALLSLSLSMLCLSESRGEGLLLTSALLLGIGYGTLTAACHALALYCAGPHETGTATSTYFVLLDAGIGAGPYMLGEIAANYSLPAVYGVSAFAALSGLFLYYLLLGRKGRFTASHMEQDRERKAPLLHARAGRA